ncbi:MBL fold hydrolase [Ktedonobacter sp. SOSP1-52]|uniref:MBL fold metallo-hydrolase n=1 Tax=Ktedonobacter sp. SOSP1-52 TaxID=2778366 RepID=UPI001915C6B5|nr:MBL fold metallo-hydrolase [Ktedonobacter sp. SOSP1-52]GHO63257.1 MBL fold hydrolase [Ktedonobacter sp. SOSP1-52]
MILRFIYDETLAQASYLVGCAATGEALIIDPNRNIEQYIELATNKGLRITAVTETHIHADFVSGVRELAHTTGAQLYLSDMGPADWTYGYAGEAGAILLRDGATFRVGNIHIEALHTPGHTPEHLSFLLTDTAATDEPMGIFTGDFLFVGDVGRPDLLEKAAGITGTAESGARQLFRSLQRFRALPDYLQIWPGHGAGSACGRALGAIPQTTLGYEKRTNWAFEVTDEQRFVQTVLEGQPEPPTYFAEMKRINKIGPALAREGAVALPEAGAEQLAADLQSGIPVIDTRPSRQYIEEHIPGTIHVPFGPIFLNWAGWLLPFDRPFSLIVDVSILQQAMTQLRLIGLHQIAHVWTPDVLTAWKQTRQPLGKTPQITVQEAQMLLAQGQVTWLDIRGSEEYAAGHIPESQHIHLGSLQQRLQEISPEKPIVVQCQGGARSPIGASLLEAHHYPQVMDLVGGFLQWQKAGHPVVKGTKPSYR